jgi:outer membrane protein W
MAHTTQSIPLLTLFFALAGTAAPAAAEDAWQLKLSGISAQSTAGGGPNSSLGGGLALEYRATPRFGVELGGLTTAFESEAGLDFFGGVFGAESSFRMTPILTRLNVHLTPDRRADLYFGPVAGYVLMSDLTLRVALPFLGVGAVDEQRHPAEDQFTWGAHLGLDVRLGGGSSYLTAGATYLALPVELRIFLLEGDAARTFPIRSDLDPLVFHFGYAYRF